MVKTVNKIAVIVFGPQGSGKGTQAELLAKKLDLFHFDSGSYLRTLLHNPALQKNKIIRRERKLNEAGVLNTPSWILRTTVEIIKRAAALGQGIVFSGSMRTFYETFGHNENEKPNKKNGGVIDVLKRYYGNKNIFIFLLDIPEKESIKRLTERFVCSVCKGLLIRSELIGLGKIKFKICPFCGGKIVHRIDDNKKAILVRLKEYKKRTQPIFKELEKGGYKIHKIDGRPMPYKIHEAILKKLK